MAHKPWRALREERESEKGFGEAFEAAEVASLLGNGLRELRLARSLSQAGLAL